MNNLKRGWPQISRASFVSQARNIRVHYNQISGNKPYITAMLTGGSILTISDLTAQFVSSRFTDNYRFDLRRTFALCAFGTFYYGLIARKLYFVYESVFGPGRAVLKASVDCSIHTPFLLLPCFYAITGTFKGQTPIEIYEQFKKEWWTSSTASIAYWYPMMWINFRYCTPQTRILFISTGSWFHKSALSWYSNRSRVQQRMKEAEEQLEAADHVLVGQPRISEPDVVLSPSMLANAVGNAVENVIEPQRINPEPELVLAH